jgi:predicted transposase/invertase (TIGR01784 family)
LHEGQDYLELRPTISISFLNHVLFPQVPDYHSRFRLLEECHHFPFTQDIDFHILELPKFLKSAEELASGLDIWLYFLRHAEKMDTDAVPVALQRPLVVRALEELKVLTQDDLERERYEARRKAQLDHNTLVKVARMEGELTGVIHLCQRLLKRPQTPTEELANLPLEDLIRLADELQTQLPLPG